MRIDITSMFFNSSIEGETATPPWSTALGQSKKNEYRIEKTGSQGLITGMAYKSVPVNSIDTSGGSPNREILIGSVFTDIYINENKIEDSQYVLVFVREHTEKHDGRLLISYAPYIKYQKKTNQECINLMQMALGCSSNGCWFVYDISIRNQDELHFSAIVVDKDNAQICKGPSAQRSQEWNDMVDKRDYSIKELAAILKKTYEYGSLSGGSIANLFYFGVNYGEYILNKKYKPKDIIQKAELDDSLQQELSKSLKLYSLLKSQGGLTIKDTINKSVTAVPIQEIYYGAPGTGKSNAIKEYTSVEKGRFTKDFTFRTTFHPDSDYSTFVGAYKPVWDENIDGGKIVFKFRPQAFLKAYVAAWTHPNVAVALVIEEINRGNCAQIFGDIFQLLDRYDDGLSKYPIESDMDMKDFLRDALNGCIKEKWAGTLLINDIDAINRRYSEHYYKAFDKLKNGEILALPKNLSILATMNTSDQSLFPMDSAFKRRWNWKYQPIVNANKGWKIKIEGYNDIDWWAFIERINYVVSDLTKSEDKQLGYFFCMPDKDGETTISAERFVEKVVFYLWNDVFKDYSYDPDCCNKKDSTDKVLYADFYNKNSNTINIDVLVHFINQLKAIDKNDKSVLATKPSQTTPANEQNAGVNNNDKAGDNVVDGGNAENNETGQQLQLPINE